MKKLLTILFLIGSALYAQTPITTNTLVLPKQIARPAAPTTGAKMYDFFHHVEIRDSIGYTRIITARDTLFFLHNSNLQGVRDSLLAVYAWRAADPSPDATRNLGSMAYADISQFVQARDPEAKVIGTNGENNLVLSTQLSTRTKIFYNGSFLESARWTGVGTNILALVLDTRVYDTIIITN